MRIASWRRRTSSQSSDTMRPVACQRSAPQSSSVQLMSRSRASRARRASAITSGPTPSPGRRAIESAGMARIVGHRRPAWNRYQPIVTSELQPSDQIRNDPSPFASSAMDPRATSTAVAHHHQRRVVAAPGSPPDAPRPWAAAQPGAQARPAASSRGWPRPRPERRGGARHLTVLGTPGDPWSTAHAAYERSRTSTRSRSPGGLGGSWAGFFEQVVAGDRGPGLAEAARRCRDLLGDWSPLPAFADLPPHDVVGSAHVVDDRIRTPAGPVLLPSSTPSCRQHAVAPRAVSGAPAATWPTVASARRRLFLRRHIPPPPRRFEQAVGLQPRTCARSRRPSGYGVALMTARSLRTTTSGASSCSGYAERLVRRRARGESGCPARRAAIAAAWSRHRAPAGQDRIRLVALRTLDRGALPEAVGSTTSTGTGWANSLAARRCTGAVHSTSTVPGGRPSTD